MFSVSSHVMCRLADTRTHSDGRTHPVSSHVMCSRLADTRTRGVSAGLHVHAHVTCACACTCTCTCDMCMCMHMLVPMLCVFRLHYGGQARASCAMVARRVPAKSGNRATHSDSTPYSLRQFWQPKVSRAGSGVEPPKCWRPNLSLRRPSGPSTSTSTPT